MPAFGRTSRSRLETCHPDLQRVFKKVVKTWDCSVLEGHRSKEKQDKLFSEGKSKVRWPNSKHNPEVSMAVDVAPYPIDWEDLGRFYMFAGYVLRVAEEEGVKLRYGGDWDGDGRTADQTFHDLPHFELEE